MSPLLVMVEKPDGNTAIISAQVGYISDLVGASKDIIILERSKYDPKNAKAGIEVGKYRCTIVENSRYIIISLTGGEYRPIPDIYVSFYSGIKEFSHFSHHKSCIIVIYRILRRCRYMIRPPSPGRGGMECRASLRIR